MPALAVVLLAAAVQFQVRPALAEAGSEDRVYVISYQQGTVFHELMRERLQHIYDIAGLAVRFVGMPHKRSLHAANTGEVDGEAGRVPAIEKIYPNLLRVDAKLADITGHAYVMQNSDIRCYSPSLLDSLRVGILSGVHWSMNVTQYSQVVEVAELDSQFKLLDYERADLILAVTTSATEYLSRLGPEQQHFRRLEPPVYSSPVYHYLNRKNADIIPALNRAARIYFQNRKKDQ